MSNKTQLQTNNTKYASLIETLRGKAAGGSGEDVSNETNAYTNKITALETAVAELETALEGKASGGSSGGNLETCTVTVVSEAPGPGTVWYLDGSSSVKTIYFPDYGDSTSITVLKNSIIAITSLMATAGNITHLVSGAGCCVFFVSGDCSITYIG